MTFAEKIIRRLRFFTVAGFCILHFVVPPESSAQEHLYFGVYTSDKPTEMVKQFRPILNALEEGMGKRLGRLVKISMQVAGSYEEGIDDIVKGNVDFCRLGPVSYIEAKKRNPDLSVLVLENSNGEKVFYGIICVLRDSPIRTIADLRGKSFAFGDEQSTIGRYLSQDILLKNNIRASDLSSFQYLSRHDKVGEAVGAGLFDAGALKEDTFSKLVEQGISIRAIERFPNVTKPWLARSGMSQELKEALTVVLKGINAPDVLKDLGMDGFVDGNDRDYDVIKEAIERNPGFFEK